MTANLHLLVRLAAKSTSVSLKTKMGTCFVLHLEQSCPHDERCESHLNSAILMTQIIKSNTAAESLMRLMPFIEQVMSVFVLKIAVWLSKCIDYFFFFVEPGLCRLQYQR